MSKVEDTAFFAFKRFDNKCLFRQQLKPDLNFCKILSSHALVCASSMYSDGIFDELVNLTIARQNVLMEIKDPADVFICYSCIMK